MARFTKWLAILTAALCFVTVLSFVVTDRTLNKNLVTSERPWVDIRDGKTVADITFDSNGARITVEFYLINTGHTPAMLTDASFNVFFEKDGWLEKIKKFEMPEAVSQLSGDVIFPGNTGNPRVTIGYIPRSDIETAERRPGRILPLLAQICARYEFSFTAGQHRTCKTYRITQPNGYLLIVPDPEANIPAKVGVPVPGGSVAN